MSPDFQEQLATVAMENAALKERVAALEQAGDRNKRWSKARILGLVFMFVPLAGSQYFLSQTFSGRWWSIHDRQDRISAWFDDTGLQLKDSKGTVRAKLGLSPGDGAPILQFFDERNQVRARLFQYTDGSAYLMLWDKDGKGVRYPPSTTPMP